jgi:hypothetical protein
MRYLFSLMEKDFDKEMHVLTGLWDEHGHPIVRMKFSVEKKNPIGFGRNDEWLTQSTPNTNSPS